jgi:hypothetical protein
VLPVIPQHNAKKVLNIQINYCIGKVKIPYQFLRVGYIIIQFSLLLCTIWHISYIHCTILHTSNVHCNKWTANCWAKNILRINCIKDTRRHSENWIVITIIKAGYNFGCLLLWERHGINRHEWSVFLRMAKWINPVVSIAFYFYMKERTPA